MNPEQQQPAPPQMPEAAPQSPVVPPQQPTPQKSHRKTVGIWLIIGPTLLIILPLILGLTLGLAGGSDNLFGDVSVIAVIINVILFVSGAIGVLAWLPCLIIGIVLLATQKK